MPTLIIINTNSDLSGGANFNKALGSTITSPGPQLAFAVAPSATETDYAYSPAGVPFSALWDAGDWPVSLEMFGAAAGVFASLQVSRVDSSGTVQESAAASAEQELTAIGTYNFTMPGMTWTSGAVGDRHRVSLIWRNSTGLSKTVRLRLEVATTALTSPVGTPMQGAAPAIGAQGGAAISADGAINGVAAAEAFSPPVTAASHPGQFPEFTRNGGADGIIAGAIPALAVAVVTSVGEIQAAGNALAIAVAASAGALNIGATGAIHARAVAAAGSVADASLTAGNRGLATAAAAGLLDATLLASTTGRAVAVAAAQLDVPAVASSLGLAVAAAGAVADAVATAHGLGVARAAAAGLLDANLSGRAVGLSTAAAAAAPTGNVFCANRGRAVAYGSLSSEELIAAFHVANAVAAGALTADHAAAGSNLANAVAACAAGLNIPAAGHSKANAVGAAGGALDIAINGRGRGVAVGVTAADAVAAASSNMPGSALAWSGGGMDLPVAAANRGAAVAWAQLTASVLGVWEHMARVVRTRFDSLVQVPDLRLVIYDNEVPEDSSDELAFIRLRFEVASGEGLEFGVPQRHRKAGEAVASVFVRSGLGDARAWQVANAINAAFRGVSEEDVIFEPAPWCITRGRVGDLWELEVRVPYFLDELAVVT